MKYSNATLEELKRSKPWAIIKSRIPSMQKEGAEAKARCPFHEDDTPSFTVRKDSSGVFLFKCFGCGENGNILQFVEKFDKIPFTAAVEKVKHELQWEEGKETVEATFQEVVPEKPKTTYPLSNLKKWEHALAESEAAQKWLRDRGVQWDAVDMHLGFVQDLSAISPGHPWVKLGWVAFPTVNGEKVTGIKFRSVMGKKTPDGKSGILRAPGMETSLYNLSAITPFEDAWLVEGEPDTVVMTQAGYASVGLPSDKYSPQGFERDILTRANRIFLAGDMDTVGRDAMKKLWGEFKDRSYLVEWPKGCKDANDAFLKVCDGDIEKFQSLIENLKIEALERPMQFMYDLKQSIQRMDKTNPFDDPNRLRFPWPSIDKWAAIVPGDIMALFATETKTGKSTWLMNILLHNAINYGKVVVNYSAELSPAGYARRVVSYLAHQDRESLKEADFHFAFKRMGEARFYNGYQPKANYKSVIDLLVAAKKRFGADVFVIDHLHFLTRGTKDETQAVAEAMRLLKDFAFDYNVIVVVVGQPRKMPSNRRAQEATLQDAKSSEAFGSDSSQIFIMHRDRTDMREGEPIFSPVTKIKLDASRESESRFTNLMFEGKTCTFYEMAKEEKMH